MALEYNSWSSPYELTLPERRLHRLLHRLHEDNLHVLLHLGRNIMHDIFAVCRGKYYFRYSSSMCTKDLVITLLEPQHDGFVLVHTFSLIPPTGVTRPRRVTFKEDMRSGSEAE